MTEQLFITQYNQLPETLKRELNAFLEYLVFKYQIENKKAVPGKDGNKKPLTKKAAPKAGFLKGTFVMSPDFDEPLEDFKEYMA